MRGHSDIFTYHLHFHSDILASIAADVVRKIDVLSLFHVEGSERVTILAIGDDAIVAEVLAYGYVARGLTQDAVWRNVSADGPFLTIEV